MNKFVIILIFIVGGLMNLNASSNSIEVDIDRCLCRIDETDYPVIGFGTFPLTGSICAEAVSQAANIGYRIIDTATYYRNFDAIAAALKGQDRRSFYIISKVWHDKQSPEDLRKDLHETLNQLDIDYLDAYLLHWPNSAIPIEQTLSAMEELRREKKIRHIGLSNVSANHVKRALECGVHISWVQIEMHPQFYDPTLLEFCKEHSIIVQAWGPLGRGRISEDAMLAKIGEKYGKTPSQVAIRWIIQHGCMPLPGSKNEKHMLENREVSDFQLSVDEMNEIDQRAMIGERERYSKKTSILDDEFDFSYEECWPR